MSIIGTATGTPATIDSLVSRIPLRSHKATSVEVPPISKVIMLLRRAAAAARKLPITPPAGPERIVRTGSFAATVAEMLPPDDCITRKLKDDLALVLGICGDESSCLLKDCVNRVKYLPSKGCKYAFTTTVDVRSYSRYSGRI